MSAMRPAGSIVLALVGMHAARELRQAHALIAQLAHLHIEALPS